MVANVSVWSFKAIRTFTFRGVGLGAKKGEAEEQEEKEEKGGEVVNTETGLGIHHQTHRW